MIKTVLVGRHASF